MTKYLGISIISILTGFLSNRLFFLLCKDYQLNPNPISNLNFALENLLSDIMCNKLFIGVDGIDLEHGLTTSNLGEALLNQQMIRSAQKVIVLTDSTKFGKRGFGKICEISMVDEIITDINAPLSVVQAMREKGINVVLV